MSSGKSLRSFVYLIAVAALCASPSGAAGSVFELGFEFSGGTAPDGPGPWLRATFIDDGGTGMYITLDSLLTGPTEFVNSNTGWVFNFDPTLNPNLLDIDYFAGPYPNLAVVSMGVDAFKADGDGFFDISFNFPQSPPANRFNGSDSVTYHIAYPGVDLTNAHFTHPSTPGGGNGSFFSAAHVQGTGGGGQSGWIGSQSKVPEPTTLALLTLGGLAVLLRRRR